MGELARLLSQPTADEPESSTIFDSEGNFTQARVLDKQPESPRELLECFGHDADIFAIDGSISVTHRELVDGRLVSTYRYKLVERRQALDIDELVSVARSAKLHRLVGSEGPFWFVFQAGDLQLGKRSRDGSTAEIVETYFQSVARAVEEFKYLEDYGISGIQLSFPGDCIEGVVSQEGKNVWLTQETITEQTRIFRRLLMSTVEAFAPLADKIYLDVVNGNHDQAQRQWNTYPGDGWATEAAVAVDDALKMNQGAFGHVEVRVPDKWSGYMTVPVGDSLVTVAHGHQWRPNQGMKWWQEQVFGGQNPKHAHVLQNGHFHEMGLERAGDRIRVQSSTFDCGSDWYRESHGAGGSRGALTYLLCGGEVSRLSQL